MRTLRSKRYIDHDLGEPFSSINEYKLFVKRDAEVANSERGQIDFKYSITTDYPRFPTRTNFVGIGRADRVLQTGISYSAETMTSA